LTPDTPRRQTSSGGSHRRRTASACPFLRRKDPAFRLSLRGAKLGAWCVSVLAGGVRQLPGSSSFPLAPLFIILRFLLLALCVLLLLLHDLLVSADVILLGLGGGGAFVVLDGPSYLLGSWGGVRDENESTLSNTFATRSSLPATRAGGLVATRVALTATRAPRAKKHLDVGLGHRI